MDNYFYKSVVDGKNWILTVMDDDGDAIFHYEFPSFTDDKLTGSLIPDGSLVDLGVMKSTRDTEGLEKYLKDNGWIKEDDKLHSEPKLLSDSETKVIEYGNRIKRAKQSDLVVLPKGITGTNCFNCKFIAKSTETVGYCSNHLVLQDVTPNMCCYFWDAEQAVRVADMLIDGKDPLQEKFEKGGVLPKETFYVEFIPFHSKSGLDPIVVKFVPNTDDSGFHSGYNGYDKTGKKMGLVDNIQMKKLLESGEYKKVSGEFAEGGEITNINLTAKEQKLLEHIYDTFLARKTGMMVGDKKEYSKEKEYKLLEDKNLIYVDKSPNAYSASLTEKGINYCKEHFNKSE